MKNYSYELLLFWGEISALICNFKCEITKLPWQPSVRHSVKTATKFSNAVNEDVRAQKDALENLNTQEMIKKDSKRYFAEKIWTILNFVSQI